MDIAAGIHRSTQNFEDQAQRWSQIKSLDGRFIINSTPSRFRSTINSEIQNLSAIHQEAACKFAFNLIVLQHRRDSLSVDTDTLSLWTTAYGGGVQPLLRQPPLSNQVPQGSSHGGGVQPAGQLPPPFPGSQSSPALFDSYQARSNLAASWNSPLAKPQKFAFGRQQMSPVILANSFSSPSHLFAPSSQQNGGISAQFSSNVAPPSSQQHIDLTGQQGASAAVNAGRPGDSSERQLGGGSHSQLPSQFNAPPCAPAVPAGQQFQQMPASLQQLVPPSQQHPMPAPSSQAFPHLHAAMLAQNPNLNMFIRNEQMQHVPLHIERLQQLQFGRSNAPLTPWEVAALSRPPRQQDPDMMPGFSRRNIQLIIDAARRKRLAQPEASRNAVMEIVVWPQLKSFTAEHFHACRLAFQLAVERAFSSGIFKEFKDCIVGTAKSACQRQFLLQDEKLWLELEDATLMQWLSHFFGPKSKEDALRRLKNVKFPEHEDECDSQSTFVNKLEICALEFELVVNDIADTHTSWLVDRSLMSSGELTIKEVMEAWRRKFPVQDRRVFSVQMKDCRDFLDREKDLLFNDMVLILVNNFTQIDVAVADGKTAYTTHPTRKRNSKASDFKNDLRPPQFTPKSENLGKRNRSDPPRPSPSASKFKANGGNTKPPKKIVAGHARGIACGSLNNHFGLGCSATTCPIWGTKYDKNKSGHSWKDFDKEETVYVPNEHGEYDALIKAKPGILLKWAAAKEQQTKAKFSAKVSAIQGGESATSSEDEEYEHDQHHQALEQADEQNDPDASDESEVNDGRCALSALASPRHEHGTAAHILRSNKMQQFFGVSRVPDNFGGSQNVRTLLDPGAEYNIVSKAVRDKCCVQSLDTCVALYQGHKKQCDVDELARCCFELQNSNGEFVKYSEWCLVRDLGYDLLLGRKFCHDNSFTRFNELLTEWKERHPSAGAAVAAIESKEPASNPSLVFIKFRRVRASPCSNVANRPDKSLRCLFPLTSDSNRIANRELIVSNPASAIEILQRKSFAMKRRDLPEKQVKLTFQVETANKQCSSIEEWFTIDDTLPKGFIQLAKSSAAADVIANFGNLRAFRQTPAALADKDKSAPSQRSSPQPPSIPSTVNDESIQLDFKQHLENEKRCLQRLRKFEHNNGRSDLSPLLSADGQAVVRFSRRNLRGRTALLAHVDKFAAHNVIDESFVSDCYSNSAIKRLDTKESADVKLCLLEYTMEFTDKQASKIKLREWFRVMKCPDHRKIVIRDFFDAERFKNQSTLGTISSLPVYRRRLCAPSPDLEEDVKAENFERSAKRRVVDSRFVSRHPISHYRLHRDVNRPPLLPSDMSHGSYLGNARKQRNAEMHTACLEAQLMCNVASSQRTIKQLIGLLPPEDSRRESAALSAMHAPYSRNFESALDECNRDLGAAHIASLSAPDNINVSTDQPWTGNPLFKPGVYVEIGNAVTTTFLNGKRARLYEKSALPSVWIIRVLGKNSGLWKCHEKFLSCIPENEQARAAPVSSDAGFLDVAIDETGQPTGEKPSIIHRQFGAEYSTALTAKIEELKAKHRHVFSKDVSEPCGFEKMKIRLIPNAILPSKSRFYRNTPKMKEEVKRQIQEQLDWGAIRRAETAHCSDILLVKRPHMPGHWRFVINFQKLNDATVPEQLIMPDPASQHARLAGCKIFGALDMSSYFRQLQLDEDSQYLTGFASDEGTFVHTRVPMGIKNAPSFAQRVLQEALAKDPVLGPLGVKNYFDDVPFGAKSEDEFLMIMEAMLEFCIKWKLKINPEKCVFGVTSITHVGFIVSENGVAIDPERSRDISDLEHPKSIKKVQSVLGVMNYVRNFVPNFSILAKHLTDKLSAAPVMSGKQLANPKPTAPFVWTTEDQTQFEVLKAAVLKAPMLAQLDYSKQIFIRCDASRFGAGAVLFQYDDQGREHVACYASRKFIPAETRWSTFQQEASTVVWALERFREFTQGYNVIIECDHRNISFVKRSSMPQLARWRMRLQDHDFTIRFLSGASNSCADGLSRTHVDDVEVSLADAVPECSLLYAKPSTTEDIAIISAIEIAPYRTRSAAAADNEAQHHESNEESDNSSDDSSVVSSDSDNDDEPPRFGANGEVLDANGLPVVAEENQPPHLSAPFVSADAEITTVHNDLSGHSGVYVTLQRLLRNGRSWGSRKQMLNDIDSFLLGCPVCQKMKKRRGQVLVDRHTISGSPFAELSIDVLKLPQPDTRGNKYCIVIIDNFSRWVSLTACANKSAFDAARALSQFIGNFGAPLRLRSDGGKEFVNGVIVGLARMMGVSPVVVQPYTPTANGIVERENRAILERAREMCMCERLAKHTAHQWGDLLPMIQRSLNASFHSSIGTSPSRILFGECIDLDRAILSKIPANKVFDMTSYCDVLAFNQRVIIEEANRFQQAVCDRVIAKSAAKQRNLPAPNFNVNDWVLIKPQPKFPLHKLAPRWPGPFRIHEISSSSEKVMLVDTVSNKLFSALKRQLELFDISRMSDVSGLKRVAESDNFEFPVEAIVGHAILSGNDVGVDPIQLQSSFIRGVRPKKSFQFLVKWTGYDEPTWIKYQDAKRLVQFPGYAAVFPGLNMN
jgi:transposase InsO family protein